MTIQVNFICRFIRLQSLRSTGLMETYIPKTYNEKNEQTPEKKCRYSLNNLEFIIW